MTLPAEAFLLLTLPNITLSLQGVSQTGVLNLECVTVQLPDASTAVQRDVYLVLRLGSIETPIDPTRVIRRTDGAGWRTYNFLPVDSDPSELILYVSLPASSEVDSHVHEDLETFEGILAQYGDLQRPSESISVANSTPTPPATSRGFEGSASEVIDSSKANAIYGDLRGRLVVVNQDNGEVVGQIEDSKFRLEEDPTLLQQGHENDAVIIEVPDTRSGEEQDADALQMFIRAVPPDQQDWITKSATIVSTAISTTTNLLLTTITTASNYYISHSTPSPYHPRSSPASASTSKSPTPTPTPGPPPRALVFLTSERTRKGLSTVHAVSGQAVQVTSKTVSLVDNMIRRAMGSKPKQPRQFLPRAVSPTPSQSTPYPTYPPRATSPSGAKGSYLGPPPTYPGPPPPLPTRRSPSLAPPLPPRTVSGPPPNSTIPVLPPRVPLSRTARVLLSADLILSTIDHETRRLLDGGTQTIGSVVGHKYGPQAAESSLLMAGTARNVGLVYIDMRGIGRRALLRRAGTHFVKGQVRSYRDSEQVKEEPKR
ncbi:hypothetical protein DXG03_005987 [Asterophora parasitica]|uniref:Senescence domain-containing protein n=1 Tax=Asterophora parasitica TaxID=117018 RepID=A0A9P7K9M8_9AGAR|nr:hypothetical protein DXG03_005987 [Asterophora parasitica]